MVSIFLLGSLYIFKTFPCGDRRRIVLTIKLTFFRSHCAEMSSVPQLFHLGCMPTSLVDSYGRGIHESETDSRSWLAHGRGISYLNSERPISIMLCIPSNFDQHFPLLLYSLFPFSPLFCSPPRLLSLLHFLCGSSSSSSTVLSRNTVRL